MQTSRRRRSIPATLALLILGACGQSSAQSPVTVTAEPTATSSPLPAAESTPAAADTTATTPATSAEPLPTVAPPPTTFGPTTTAAVAVATPAPTLPTTDPDAPARLSVTVGVDSSPDRREIVARGRTVVLSIVNPTSTDEFHLHHFDLGGGNTVPPGQPASFTFVADEVGEFALESHATHKVLLTLVVQE